jgi:hypothetical protein
MQNLISGPDLLQPPSPPVTNPIYSITQDQSKSSSTNLAMLSRGQALELLARFTLTDIRRVPTLKSFLVEVQVFAGIGYFSATT